MAAIRIPHASRIDPDCGQAAPFQVRDETPQQVVVRRRDGGDHVTKLGRVERPYRPIRRRDKRRGGHDRHPHPGRRELRGRARAARAQRRLGQHDPPSRRELLDPDREPVVRVVVHQRLTRQFGQRHGAQPGEPVLRGGHHHDLLAAEQFGVLVVARRPRPDGEVGLAARERVGHPVRAGVLLQRELDVREPAAPAAQHRDENPRRHRLRAGDADAAPGPGRRPAPGQHDPVRGGQRDPRLRRGRQPGRGRPDAPRQALDDRGAQLPLQRGNLVRQGRLRHVQGRCRPGQRVLVHDGDQALQCPQRSHS